MGALALRLAYLGELSRTVVFLSPLVDAYTYDQMARAVVSGGFGALELPFYQPPAYPLGLAALYRLVGTDPWIPRIAQALLGTWTVGLVFSLARRWAGLQAAWVAGALMGAYGAALYFEGELLPPTVLLTLIMAAVWLLARAQDGESTGRWRPLVGAGIALGIAGAIRPTLLLLGTLVALWWLLGSRSERRRGRMEAGLLLAAMAVPILPFTLANRIGGGENVLVSTNGGINFYLGNGANSDSLTAIQPGYAWDRLQLQPLLSGHATAVAESDYWWRRGLREAGADPGAWAAAAGRKVLRLLDVRETPRNTDYEDFRRDSRILSLPWPGFGVVAPLAALGLCLGFPSGRRRDRWLLAAVLGAVALENVAFFVAGRYRLEAVPVLCVLAGLGVDAAIRRRGRIGVRAAVALALTATVVWFDFLGERPIDETRAAIHRAVARDRAGLPASAARAVRDALRTSPNDVDAHALLGTLLLRGGDVQGALASFDAALIGADDHLRALLGAAQCLERLSRPVEAEAYYRRAVAADPFSADARLGLGVNLAVRQLWSDAREQFEQGLRISPNDERLRNNLRRLEQERERGNVLESPPDSAHSSERSP